MATTIMPGISAAIVINGISKISEMIAQADAAMQGNIGREINAALRAIQTSPDASKVGFKEQASAARGALGDANLEGKNPNIDRMPLFLENVIGSFFEDYTGKLDALFPGLGMAGADADAFVRAALTSAVGMSYNEVVDSTQAHTAFLMAQRQTFAKEREALDTAAGAGHRFAPGQVLEAIARARGLADVAPYFIDADAASDPGAWPRGGLTVIRFPNSHLVYALTWFGMALLSLVGMGLVLRERGRGKGSDAT